jgi:hypothetical protein
MQGFSYGNLPCTGRMPLMGGISCGPSAKVAALMNGLSFAVRERTLNLQRLITHVLGVLRNTPSGRRLPRQLRVRPQLTSPTIMIFRPRLHTQAKCQFKLNILMTSISFAYLLYMFSLLLRSLPSTCPGVWTCHHVGRQT